MDQALGWVQVVVAIVGATSGAGLGVRWAMNGMRDDVREIRKLVTTHEGRISRIEGRCEE